MVRDNQNAIAAEQKYSEDREVAREALRKKNPRKASELREKAAKIAKDTLSAAVAHLAK